MLGIAVARPAFDALVALRHFEDDPLVSPRLLRHQVAEVIDRMIADARARGYLAEEIDELVYPVIALIDEVALGKGGALAEVWISDLLQVAYFQENVAGDRFFRRLEGLMTGPGGERARDALAVYYACLALGFQGRYQMLGGESELRELSDRVAAELGVHGPIGRLSPAGERPQERRLVGRAAFPVIGLALVALISAVVLVALLGLRIDGRAEAVSERLEAAARGPAGGG